MNEQATSPYPKKNMTKPKKEKQKPMTKKQKELVDEAARRFAEILISHLEWKKSQQTKSNKK